MNSKQDQLSLLTIVSHTFGCLEAGVRVRKFTLAKTGVSPSKAKKGQELRVFTRGGHSLEEKLGAGPAQETDIRWALFSSATDM